MRRTITYRSLHPPPPHPPSSLTPLLTNLRSDGSFPAASAVSFYATFFGGKAWEMVNSYTARGNGRAVKQHDTSGVRHKKFEDGDVDEEGVDGRTADPNFFSRAHRTHVTDIEKKRPSAAGNYDEGGDAFAKVRGKLVG